MVRYRLIVTTTLLAVSPIALGAKRELTPADAVATVRIVENQRLSGQPTSGDFASPDGQRYLIRLVYGDPKRNGVWMDLLTGSLDSMEDASHPTRCAHLLTTGLGSTSSDISAEFDPTATNVIRWTDSTHVAFLWSDQRSIRQIVSVDLTTCKHRFLTHEAADVFSFAPAPNGAILFNSHAPAPKAVAETLWARGFTVGDSSDGLSILRGYVEDGSKVESDNRNAWHLQSKGRTTPLNIDNRQFDPSDPHLRDLSVGPSGRYAVVWIGSTSIPQGWEQYPNPSLQRALTGQQKIRVPVRYTVIDLHTGDSHMLWNSPLSLRGAVHWSPSDDIILLSPTYLPVDAHDPLGLTGNAAATIDVRSGEYLILPLDLTDRSVLRTAWISANEIEIASTNSVGTDLRDLRFTRTEGLWKVTSSNDKVDDPPVRRAPIRLETRQSLNTPPQILGIDTRTGESRLIVDPNPRLLTDFKLGHVERMSGTLANGQNWIGQLTYPADYRPGVKYPLVIQSMYGNAGFGAEEFTLGGDWEYSGMGLGPMQIACYVGQLLATRNIAVLTLKLMHASEGFRGSDERQLAFEALARQLIDSGLVDGNKVALNGFSRNGYFVEYTLAHSSFAFAAAIASDNYDPSYFQSALGNWRDYDVDLNGGPAFGAGLQEWLKHAPGFNAEHIRTPLLMIGQSAGIAQIIGEWEIYSRLRYLHKPVEMYMMPRANEHPSHTPQNPQQIIAVQENTIDWLDFWLTGHEDPSLDKREQYARWRRLAASSAVANP